MELCAKEDVIALVEHGLLELLQADEALGRDIDGFLAGVLVDDLNQSFVVGFRVDMK